MTRTAGPRYHGGMPSPFPGMDPWLESSELWPGVHATMIAILRELLVPSVRPRYFVDIERRVYVLDEEDPARRHVVPDLAITKRSTPGPKTHPPTNAPTTGTMVMMVQDEVVVRESRLLVLSVADRSLVTVIEILSPSNKTPGSHGQAEYLDKRREVFRSPVHFVEIDLLRGGARVPSREPLPPGDYLAHVSRAGQPPRGEVFTWTVRDPAPTIPIPLRPGEAEPGLDLGQALRLVYERGGYDLEVDYARPPEPPLSAQDAAWAAERLAGWKRPE